MSLDIECLKVFNTHRCVDVNWSYQIGLNDGTLIEPSVEHGYDALDETRVQAEKMDKKRG